MARSEKRGSEARLEKRVFQGTGQVGVLDGQMVDRGWAGGQVVGVT